MIIYQQLEGFDEQIYYFCVVIPTDKTINKGTEYYWDGESQKTEYTMSYDKKERDFRKVLQYD